MSTDANRIVQKLWSYCTVLRDDGLSYGDYLEQLSVLLFLKLAHEQTQPPWNQASPELLARDKINLDLFWLKDNSLLDSDNLPDPDLIATEIADEIADDLRSALEQIESLVADL